MSFVDIAGKAINTERIQSAEIDQRFYMNGSAAFLVVRLVDGTEIRREHGWGFDAYETLDRIKAAQ